MIEQALAEQNKYGQKPHIFDGVSPSLPETGKYLNALMMGNIGSNKQRGALQRILNTLKEKHPQTNTVARIELKLQNRKTASPPPPRFQEEPPAGETVTGRWTPDETYDQARARRREDAFNLATFGTTHPE
jgi:hypothetical protein